MTADLAMAAREAQRVLNENYVLAPPVDPYRLAESEGLTVSTVTFPNNLAEYSGYIDLESKTIFVNSKDSIARRRFTIAHEIGHWVMHREALSKDPNIGIVARRPLGRPNDDTREKEANTFAASLLVPYNLLNIYQSPEFAPQASPDALLLAQWFGVSEDVIRFRLANITRQK